MDHLLEFIANNWVLFVALAAVLAWIVMSEFTRMAHGVPALDTVTATRIYNKEDGLFVDLRGETEFRKGHLPAAVNVPQGNIESRPKRLDRHKKKPVIVYCLNGLTSGKAGKQLKNAGFEKVYQLKGGFRAWEDANLPIEAR